MLDLNTLFAFSHTYCIAICAVLVPFNLFTTILTLAFTGLAQPKTRVWQSSGFAIAGSLLMVLHVLSWLVVGVVRVPTFVLFTLGLVCLVLNLWAIWQPNSLRRVIRWLVLWAQQSVRSMVQWVEIS